MRFQKLKNPALCLLAGWLTLLAMPPWGLWPTAILGLSGFYWLLNKADNKKQGFLYGWLFGMGYFLPGLAWIGNALLVEGNDFKWVWPLAILGLPILLSLFYGYAGCLYTICRRPNSRWILYVFLLVMAEWVRGHIFTGFPWNLFGYAWAGTPSVLQTASIGGVYLLSLLTVIWCSTPALLCDKLAKKHFKIITASLVCISLLATCIYGHIRLNSNPTVLRNDVVIRLVQPNIPQHAKWNPNELSANLQKLITLSRPEGTTDATTIIVWPETAITQTALNAASVQQALQDTMQMYGADVYLSTGILRSFSDKNQYFNSLTTLNKDLETVSNFDKSHLVPFGEYIPFKDYIPFKPFAFYNGFTAGSGSVPTKITDGFYFNPLICYEIVFPSEMKTATNKTKSSAIINVTNDAWYGDSSGPRQHFAMTKFRAVERGLPVVRVANTGISGIVDPLGRVTTIIPLETESAQNGALPKPLERSTIYNRYGELTFLSLVLILLLLLFRDPRASQNRRNI